jgi:uncharacterized membrane protein YobD (UPF0266 family)
MTPLGNLVVLWGGGLLIANVLYDPIFASFRQGIIGGSIHATDLNTSPVHMLIVGLITLLIAGFLANDNPKWAKSILWALAGLTVLWLISYNNSKQQSTPTPKGNAPGPSKVATG